VIDVDFFALENAFEVNYYRRRKWRCPLVDIAPTDEHQCPKERRSMFNRDASVGGHQITQDIQDRFGLDYEEAEKIKLGTPSPKVPGRTWRPFSWRGRDHLVHRGEARY